MYELEFSYFSGCEWGHITVKIVANSTIQLMKSFINETSDIHEPEMTQKRLWKKVKKDIEIVEYPLVLRTRWNY